MYKEKVIGFTVMYVFFLEILLKAKFPYYNVKNLKKKNPFIFYYLLYTPFIPQFVKLKS